MSKEFEEVKAAWNKQADGFNQWPELCEEEKVDFAFRAGRALGRRESAKVARQYLLGEYEDGSPCYAAEVADAIEAIPEEI